MAKTATSTKKRPAAKKTAPKKSASKKSASKKPSSKKPASKKPDTSSGSSGAGSPKAAPASTVPSDYTSKARSREQRFDRHMSDFEALMWNIEKDPWLNPSGASIAVTATPIDFDQFAHRMRYAVSKVSRLRERVVPGVGRLRPPVWATDPEFDFGYHVRHISLPAPGSTRQLFDLCTRLYEDPYDRTRPLWMFVVIDGVEGGGGALFTKMHHTVSDGIGMVRISELYMEVSADEPLPPDVDLDQMISDSITEEADEERSVEQLLGSFAQTVEHAGRRQAGIGRRLLGELAIWTADPSRALEALEDAIGGVTSVARQVGVGGVGSGEEAPSGSPLWAKRSRRRHVESVRLSLADAKAAGKALGGSINDVFVTGITEAATRYHAKRGVEVAELNSSFVVSTRTDDAMGGNSFTPTPVRVPGRTMAVEDRFTEIRDRMAERRENAGSSSSITGLAGVANLLPTSVVAQVARKAASKMDFATSNLRGAPFQLYLSGAAIESGVTMGPVAGTAFNVTAISGNGALDIGVFIDPAAVEDPADLKACLVEAFSDLLAAGGVDSEVF